MSGDAQTTLPPPVMWAQRSKAILLTICLEDCKKPVIKIYNDGVYFKGIGGSDKKEYEVTINLYKEVDPAKSLFCIRDRIIEFALHKKDEGPFWPQLTKEKTKYHWLKVDFNKWIDEDDSGEESEVNDDLMNMLEKGIDLGGGSGKTKIDSDESDSDDEDLPDLE